MYLGLVLVGATPAALSQAAMTRQFDIKSEIEYKDDLDNKPDEPFKESEEKVDELDLLDFRQYAGTVTSFVKGYYQTEVKNSTTVCIVNLEQPDGFFSTLREDLIFSFADFKAEKDSFFFKIGVAPKLADEDIFLISSAFKASLNSESRKSQFRPEKLIYDNTKVITENNQVFIVTRLPRAAIDEFLATTSAS